ncbi:MAG: NTP transferase domain-containing protein [Actinomycetota bacterium]|nr:NTP transferase domain-containing protein [Actinomycetota bacterium]
MSSRPLSAVVLAAGEGARMRSARPKPLHVLCGRAMVMHVIHALAGLRVDRVVVVVGHGGEQVTKAVTEDAPPGLVVDFIEQRVQRGTGDAMSVALEAFPEDELNGDDVLVLPGDTPLLDPETLAALVGEHRATDAAATVLTAQVATPTGYGRVLRDRHGNVTRVVEEADASDLERMIDEVNTSIYCFRRAELVPALRRLTPQNAQGEYYLTDVLAVLHDAGYPVATLPTSDPMEAAGVNDRAQLAMVEAELRARTNNRWMRQGVTMIDPAHTYVDVSVELSPDVTLFPGTLLQGSTRVSGRARIGPHTRLVDCLVGEGAVVEQTDGRQCEIGADARVGPLAALGPGSRVPPATVTGPFFTAGVEDEGGSAWT